MFPKINHYLALNKKLFLFFKMNHRETTFIRYTRAYTVNEVEDSQLGFSLEVSSYVYWGLWQIH